MEASRSFSADEVTADIGFLPAQPTSSPLTIEVRVCGTPYPLLPVAQARVVLESRRWKREAVGGLLRSLILYGTGFLLGVAGLSSLLRSRVRPRTRAA